MYIRDPSSDSKPQPCTLGLTSGQGLDYCRSTMGACPWHAKGLYRTRHYDEATAKAREVLELDPNFSNAYATLAYAYERKQDYSQAVENDLQVWRLANRSEQEIMELRKTFVHSGWQAYWTAKLKLLQKGPPNSIPTYVFVEIYSRLGDKPQALNLLEKSFDERSDAPLLIGVVEPLLDPCVQMNALSIYQEE